MGLDPTPRSWRVGGKAITSEGDRWEVWGPEWPVGEVRHEDDAKLIVAAVNREKVLLAEEDHELCESQVTHLVEELKRIKDSPAWPQLSRSLQDRISGSIRSRGVRIG